MKHHLDSRKCEKKTKSVKSGPIPIATMTKACQKQKPSDRSARFSCPCISLYTGECIHGQKKPVGVTMGLYTGGTIDVWACWRNSTVYHNVFCGLLCQWSYQITINTDHHYQTVQAFESGTRVDLTACGWSTLASDSDMVKRNHMVEYSMHSLDLFVYFMCCYS